MTYSTFPFRRTMFVACAAAVLAATAGGPAIPRALAQAPDRVSQPGDVPALEVITLAPALDAQVAAPSPDGRPVAQDLEPFVPRGLAVAGPELPDARAAAPLALPVAPDAIVGVEDRVEAPVNRYPFSAIGRIDASLGSTSWSCTGALVARAILLTNRHCVYDNAQRKFATSLMFTPGYRRGQAPYGQARGLQAYLSPVIRSTGERLDYALVTLNQNLGDSAGWLGVRPFQTSWVPSPARWTLSGYGFNWSGNPGYTTVQTYNPTPCSFKDLDDSNYVVGHDCDSGSGSSGSPIFAWFNDGAGRTMPYAVAVNFAEWRVTDKFASCGAYRSGYCGNLAVQSQGFLGPLKTLLGNQR